MSSDREADVGDADARRVQVTPGWKHVSIGLAGHRVLLGGLDPWQLKWHAMEEPPITVAHPSYPRERHQMSVYELRSGREAVKFAAGEYSNGVWGFYVPDVREEPR